MSASPRTVLDGGALGRVEIVPGERRLFVGGEAVALGSRAFDLLAALSARRERIVPKEELIAAVWPGLVVEDNNLQVQISALRKLLGTQSIATVPGRGYQLTLPEAGSAGALPAAAPGPLRAPLPPVASTRSSRLLVVDDNKVNRLLLTRALQLLGHEVGSATDGLGALEALRRQRFDLLLLDLEMPGMSGFDLLERRAAEPALQELAVIVTSAVEGVASVARCIELGADDFLHKPVDPVLLRARVDSSLERKFLRDQQRARLAQLDPGAGDAAELRREARSVPATVLVATFRADPPDAESVDPAAALEAINERLTLIVDAIEEHGGRLQQLDGAQVCAVFDAVDAAGAPAAAAALKAAREMVGLLAQAARNRRGGLRDETSPADVAAGLTIGIATGPVLLGHVGTPRRSRFLAVGAPVRRAAALAALAGRGAGAIRIDAATRPALGDAAAAVAWLPPAGPSGPGDADERVAGFAR